jgi:multiple sugar transport system substrate-binding protein
MMTTWRWIRTGIVAAALLACLVAPLAATAGQPVKLTLWSGYPEMKPYFDAAAKFYNELHPNVTIEVSTFPLRDIERKYAVSLPTNSGPDIAETHIYIAQMHIENGSLVPNPSEVTKFLKSGVFHPLFVSDSTWQGTVYGVPVLFSLDSLLYNTQMFKEAGIAAPPKNWDEMISMGKKLTTQDAQGNVTRSGLGLRLFGAGSGVAAKWWYFLKSAGGDLFEECAPKSGTYRAAYDNEAGRDTLKLYIDALYKHKIHDPKLKQDAEGFATQQAAMFVRESWLVGYMKKNAPGVQYAVAPLPAGKKTNTLLFWTNLYVTRSSKQPKEAWDFVMFMANGPKLKELEQILYNTVGWMPPRNDVQKRHPNIYTEVPQYKYFAEVPKTYELYAYPRLAVTDEAFTKLAERLVKAYQDKSLLDNPAGIAKVIHEAAEETNGILKENKLYCGK